MERLNNKQETGKRQRGGIYQASLYKFLKEQLLEGDVDFPTYD